MTSTVTLRTSPKYRKTLDFLASHGTITTGVHANEGSSDDGEITVAEIANNAEFGLGQPMRSWLRAWFDDNISEIESVLQTQLVKALDEGKSTDWALERAALWIQGSIQKNVSKGIDPRNSPLTIKMKGFDSPLIHTGVFRSSILSYLNGVKK